MQRLALIGNIGKDAEIKTVQSVQFVTFSLACTTRKKNGEQVQEVTNWYDCSTDNIKLAEYLKQGTKVYVDGNFKLSVFHSDTQQKWIPKLNVFVNHLELLSAKKQDSDKSLPPLSGQTPVQQFEAGEENKEDLPF